MRQRQRNKAWLAVMGVLVSIAILSGVASPLVMLTLAAVWASAAAASLFNLNLQPSKIQAPRRASFARLRMSPQAQEATARATRRGSQLPDGLALLDVGLIVTHSTRDGMVMRRSRAVSKDDDGVRPYITLHVHPDRADVTSVIRFEMLDPNGDTQYVHEMKTYMHDGEMNILADHQLPLDGNSQLNDNGDGDLRVYIDGVLAGALSFTVAPSLRDRDRRLNQRYAAQLQEDVIDDSPVTLEDLLRSERDDRQQRRQ